MFLPRLLAVEKGEIGPAEFEVAIRKQARPALRGLPTFRLSEAPNASNYMLADSRLEVSIAASDYMLSSRRLCACGKVAGVRGGYPQAGPARPP